MDPNPKLSGIRVTGEIKNVSKEVIKNVSPVIRFYDSDNKVIAQKIAKLSPTFDFFSFKPNKVTVYDVMVMDPPTADKLEILFKPDGTELVPTFEEIKIASVSVDVKTATYQNSNSSSSSGSASVSGEVSKEQVEYYTASGSIVNNLVDSISDVTVYVWVKDEKGNVFSLGRKDFKGDLINPGNKQDFSINLLPIRMDEKMNTYEVAAFGKRFKL